jgi:hypothetical protein
MLGRLKRKRDWGYQIPDGKNNFEWILIKGLDACCSKTGILDDIKR